MFGVLCGSLLHFGTGFIAGGWPELQGAAAAAAAEAPPLHVVKLRRELSPVRRKGKVVSHKVSYSGVISVGSPKAQEFRVVFDTGSGHVIVPSIHCASNSCLRHRQYDAKHSAVAQAVMMDGSAVQPNQATDQVTIGFGTGKVSGGFIRDRVCLGAAAIPVSSKDLQLHSHNVEETACVDAQLVEAYEMSDNPFERFTFDGILGLGLSALAISGNFSFFGLLAGQLPQPHFGVFVSDAETSEESEIAFGGHDPRRVVGPLAWVPIAAPDQGYWQVEILSFRVNGKELDICTNGTCRGILDTGTSHLGVPSQRFEEMSEMLTTPAGAAQDDCRNAEAPVIQILLQGFSLTLHPEHYMRKLPLAEDLLDESTSVSLGSTNEGNLGGGAGAAQGLPKNRTANATSGLALPGNSTAVASKNLCTPKLLAVVPPPSSPNLFILGEPMFQRYYTVFDWSGPSAGFGLARHHKGKLRGSGKAAEDGAPPSSALGRAASALSKPIATLGALVDADEDAADDELVFFQVTVEVHLVAPPKVAMEEVGPC